MVRYKNERENNIFIELTKEQKKLYVMGVGTTFTRVRKINLKI